MDRSAVPGFVVVCLNPTLQKTLVLPRLWEGQVNRVARHLLDASGKGINVARVLVQLGERAVQLCQAGGRDREVFLELARGDGVEVSWVESRAELRYCYTLVNEAQRTTTEVVEEGRPVSDAADALVRARFDELTSPGRGAHTVVVTGSRAPGFSAALFADLVAAAKRRGLRVVCDYRGADLLASMAAARRHKAQPRRTFLPELSGEVAREGAEVPERVMCAVRSKMAELWRAQGTRCIVTRGTQPTLYVAESGDVRERAIARAEGPVVNTIGCGDAFTAGYAAGMARGLSVEGCVDLGHQCGARNATCLRPGVITAAAAPTEKPLAEILATRSRL
eukprot:m51a1_g3608 putative tagatose-6-phosphate kinase (336) ;mRNA; r:52596-53977